MTNFYEVRENRYVNLKEIESISISHYIMRATDECTLDIEMKSGNKHELLFENEKLALEVLDNLKNELEK